MNTLQVLYRWWPVLYRTALYFLVAAILTLADKLGPFADKDTPPSHFKYEYFVLVAVGQGLLAIRAYLDGSAQRHSDELHKNGGTDFWMKLAAKQVDKPADMPPQSKP